jgi:hypothetical protein
MEQYRVVAISSGVQKSDHDAGLSYPPLLVHVLSPSVLLRSVSPYETFLLSLPPKSFVHWRPRIRF